MNSIPSSEGRIDVDEVLRAKAQLRLRVMAAGRSFAIRALPASLAASLIILVGAYLFRPGLSQHFYIVVGTILIVGVGVLPTVLFWASMARRYLWYLKELSQIEERIKAGEIVTRPIQKSAAEVSPEQTERDRASSELKRRNNWIDVVSMFLAFAGIVTPMYWYVGGANSHNPWPLGFGFGLMVILPTSFILAVTLPGGRGRFVEFWRFYSLKYGIGTKGLLALYVPFAMLGIVSAIKLLLSSQP